jgi:hypothetical protein
MESHCLAVNIRQNVLYSIRAEALEALQTPVIQFTNPSYITATAMSSMENGKSAKYLQYMKPQILILQA